MSWLKQGNGLLFEYPGTVRSSGAFPSGSAREEAAFSLEIWVQPGMTHDSNTLLAFYQPATASQFSLHQSDTDLMLRWERRDGQHRRRTGFYVGDIFRRSAPVFITITSDAQGTAVYVDGALTVKASQFPLLGQDYTGWLIIGTSPVENDGWTGELRGLAIYRRALNAAEVVKHVESWAKMGRPEIVPQQRGAALYLFDKRSGNTIRNELVAGLDLLIPERYEILHEEFLKPFWREFYSRWGYWKNVLINIGGFVPFGFCLFAWLLSKGQIRKAWLVTVAAGAAVSLTIEVLQAFLPTRDSGTTDLFTNTLGTYIGVVLYRWRIAQALYTKVLFEKPKPQDLVVR